MQAVAEMTHRDELLVATAPAPGRLAPHAAALTAEVIVEGEEVASGRLVVLHDPDGQDAWEGTTRLVVYAEADVEPELAADPLLPEVGWSWMTEAIERAGATCRALGGTVTRVGSLSYGVMSDREPEGRVQIRASWTADDLNHMVRHVQAWTDALCSAAGLEALPDGISRIRPSS